MAIDSALAYDLSKDTEYLAALRAGDATATERFVREHVVWMVPVARRILRDHGHAEDAVQSAFSNIFKSLDTFDGRSTVKTWMHRIVVNQALMTLRKDRQLQVTPIDDLLPIFDANGCRIEDRWATFETPETLMQRSETRAKITKQIDLLPDKYRSVLVLRDIEELSTVEVAEALELSEANVKVRLHRARSALKKLLEPLFRGQAL